jgi:hypothetical protein
LDELTNRIKNGWEESDFPETAPYVDLFRERFSERLLAVVFYGSRLFDADGSSDSFPDFFLIVDDYEKFYKKSFHRFLNRHLPPNIFYLSEKINVNGLETTLKCKYNVVSLDHLERETIRAPRDLYLLGRLTKRVALLFARDDAVADRIAEVVRGSLMTLTPHALGKIPGRFTSRDFGKALLKLSYEGEVRVENNDEKVENIYRAFETYYDNVFSFLLKNYAAANASLRPDEGLMAEEWRRPYHLSWTSGERAEIASRTKKLMSRSRRRGVARWPKGILLTDNWLDILLDKVERTHGYKIVLTPTERRFVLILGWKHFFRLLREGKIK